MSSRNPDSGGSSNKLAAWGAVATAILGLLGGMFAFGAEILEIRGDSQASKPSQVNQIKQQQRPYRAQEPTEQTGGSGKTEPSTPTSSPPHPTTDTPEPTTSIDDGQGTEEIEEDAEAAAGEYYRAAGVDDWDYTYEHLDSSTRSRFTRTEWFQKNQWLAGDGSTTYYIGSVRMLRGAGEPTTKVRVVLTFSDGSTSVRNTYFEYEDGSWKHRFSQEEYDLLMPDLSYEEFVRAQQ